MEALLEDFQPDYKRQPAQARLHRAWHHAWETYGEDILACYDIPGLPQDNLALEALFGHLRNHQRRISGRASTRPYRVNSPAEPIDRPLGPSDVVFEGSLAFSEMSKKLC